MVLEFESYVDKQGKTVKTLDLKGGNFIKLNLTTNVVEKETLDVQINSEYYEKEIKYIDKKDGKNKTFVVYSFYAKDLADGSSLLLKFTDKMKPLFDKYKKGDEISITGEFKTNPKTRTPYAALKIESGDLDIEEPKHLNSDFIPTEEELDYVERFTQYKGTDKDTLEIFVHNGKKKGISESRLKKLYEM